ncbi:class F sortase [Arthrobacter sp. H5]|uniref:class F sortase n=1 Tax=Arthrobacter sp. H5 TaxID=1267973 RepID=UPI0012DDD397|nr:class F sortase [Arthrobacter sp. H5]
MDMKILPLTPTAEDEASQSLVPPLTDDAYWLTTFGKPGDGSTDTTYITGHSWEGREAPFNRLSGDAKIGDTITLTTETGKLEYVIDSVTTHDKNTLKDSDIWDVVPNRLVVISCYTEDLWGKNVVVTAMPKW